MQSEFVYSQLMDCQGSLTKETWLEMLCSCNGRQLKRHMILQGQNDYALSTAFDSTSSMATAKIDSLSLSFATLCVGPCCGDLFMDKACGNARLTGNQDTNSVRVGNNKRSRTLTSDRCLQSLGFRTWPQLPCDKSVNRHSALFNIILRITGRDQLAYALAGDLFLTTPPQIFPS